MTGRTLAAALLPLLLAGAASAQTLTCIGEIAQGLERDESRSWAPFTEEAPVTFTLTASEGCAMPVGGDCTGSIGIDELPGETFPCEAIGPSGNGLLCPIDWVATIWAHPGSGSFVIIDVEHLAEGRRDPDVMMMAGNCEPA